MIAIEPYLTPQIVRRFNGLLAPLGDCLLWQGRLQTGGYGQFEFHSGYGAVRVVALAHRIALTLKLKRDIADGFYACHARECPNRHCCAPSHLYEGTARDNVLDAMALGTGTAINQASIFYRKARNKGPIHPAARYDQETRDKAVALHFEQGKTTLWIESELGVSHAQVARWCALDARYRKHRKIHQ